MRGRTLPAACPASWLRSITVNEAHFAEIEKTLLYVSDARKRAEKAIKELQTGDAEPHLIAALEAAKSASSRSLAGT